MSAALVEFHGFKKGDITVLTDGDATKKAMQAGIKTLVRDAKKGDVVLLHYSGHGSNVPDDNGDEADGRDEILCPTDLDWDDPLRDDWLRTTFDGLRAGVSFTAIMDCCHSGTNTRAILPPDAPVKERYLPSPWGLKAVESGRSLPRKVTSELRRSPRAARKAKDIVNADLPEVLITGCRDTQTSADAFINGRVQRRAHLCPRRGDSHRARASSRIESCTTARLPCSRRGSSIRCRSSKAGRPGSTGRCFRRRHVAASMKASSEKRLRQLHPALASAVRAVIADLAGRSAAIEVVQGLRTFEEQDELFAKGRTAPGPIVTQARGGESNHNFGLAADLCPFTNDKPDWNAPIAVWAAIGAAAMAHGLEWGGQWKKFLDKPHVQLAAMTVKECASCYEAGGLDAVWSAASKKIGWTDATREPASPARRRRAGGRTIKKKTRRAGARRRSRSQGAGGVPDMSRPDQSITFLRELRVQRVSLSARVGAASRADAPGREGPDAARHGARSGDGRRGGQRPRSAGTRARGSTSRGRKPARSTSRLA